MAGVLQHAGNALDAFRKGMEFGAAHALESTSAGDANGVAGAAGAARGQALRLNMNRNAPIAISTPPKTRFCARRARTLRSTPCSRAASQA